MNLNYEKNIYFIITMIILCNLVTGCEKNDKTIKDIKADSFNISYKDSIIYNSNGRIDDSSVESLVEKYNNIQVIGTTEKEVNSKTSILITFMYNYQISGSILIYDNGICSFNSIDNYIMSDDSNIYDDALKAYEELKLQYK